MGSPADFPHRFVHVAVCPMVLNVLILCVAPAILGVTSVRSMGSFNFWECHYFSSGEPTRNQVIDDPANDAELVLGFGSRPALQSDDTRDREVRSGVAG
jgi:hypothetical protein